LRIARVVVQVTVRGSSFGLDGQDVLGDVDGDRPAGLGSAEGDPLPGDQDDASGRLPLGRRVPTSEVSLG
jgi:hypothetical protein